MDKIFPMMIDTMYVEIISWKMIFHSKFVYKLTKSTLCTIEVQMMTKNIKYSLVYMCLVYFLETYKQI